MSPKAADPEIRKALIETAAIMLAEEGPHALSTRRLANAVGTSTMAVYTHFGGMDQLHHAIREEGFQRLVDHLQSVPKTSDPVADLSALGWAYCFNAIANPHLYRAIFLEAPAGEELAVGRAAFEHLLMAVSRCIDAGRFGKTDAQSMSTQLWAGAHGMVCAVIAHAFTVEEIMEYFSAMAHNLFIGFGDDAGAARASIDAARRRMQRSAGANSRSASSGSHRL